jgi:hypothetical protein
MLPDYYRQVADLMRGLSDVEKATLVELLMKVNGQLPSLWAAAGRPGGRIAKGPVSSNATAADESAGTF